MWIGPGRSLERKAANVSLVGSMCPVMSCTLLRSYRVEDSIDVDHSPVASAKSLQGRVASYTQADLCWNIIGDRPGVADHVRCVGYSDRARGLQFGYPPSMPGSSVGFHVRFRSSSSAGWSSLGASDPRRPRLLKGCAL